MSGAETVVGTQADREAAVAYAETVGWCVDLDWLRETDLPVPLVQAFTRHRLATTAPLIEAIEAAREALLTLEQACEQLAATRTHEVYLAMIDNGQTGSLLQLDCARRTARETLTRLNTTLANLRAAIARMGGA